MNGADLSFISEPLNGCGLTAHEAVRLAAVWWDKTGRNMIQRAVNEEREPSTYKGPGENTPAIAVKGSVKRSVDSGILDARKWDELSRREQAAITKAWLYVNRAMYPAGKITQQ